jgi:molybdopterin-containing oxidoreductase family membrane subunit
MVEEKKSIAVEEHFIEGEHTNATITDKIAAIPLSGHQPKSWFLLTGSSLLLLGCLMTAITLLLFVGVGIWGVNNPTGWGFAIVNFVWWIGIGHAGTLISAILLLMRQRWRTSINRVSETMTLFAVMCAGLFPILHLGRPWLAYYLFPYPNGLAMWPQFRSPLVWDVFAVSTYFTVSLVFWFVGLIPDIAVLRDTAKSKIAKAVSGILAMGWRNSAAHWHRYETLYLLLAGLSTPLVVSVHSIVSFDFAVSLLPGWHTTIFPPYFVAGAVYSGFAMVLTLMIPMRAWYGLKDMVTMKHIDWMAKIMLATGLIVGYGYCMEAFYAWYSGSFYEWAMMKNRALGFYAPFYWALIFCNVVTPFTLWFPWVRRNLFVLWWITIIVNIGMWLERFVIVITSLHHDFMPSSWGNFRPMLWDWAIYAGTFGLFLFGMALFMRFIPMLPMAELRHQLHAEHGERKHRDPEPDPEPVGGAR